MSISAGTHTFGAGGDYATLAAAFADLAAALTGDLTLNQVGDSDDTGADIFYTISLGGFIFTLACPTPHFGDPNSSFTCLYARFRPTFTGVGSVVYDDIHGEGNGNIGGSVLFGSSGPSGIDLVDCLFYNAGTGTGFSIASPTTLFTSFYCRTTNCKIWAERIGFNFVVAGGGATASLITLKVENNVFRNMSAADATYRPAIINFNGLSGVMAANFTYKNNVHWAASAAQPALTFTGDIGNVYKGLVAACARNQGSDTFTWAYDGITSPGDILDLSPAVADFMNDNHASALYTNGVAPVIPDNPYTAAPYPIGIAYASEPPPEVAADVWIPTFIPGL